LSEPNILIIEYLSYQRLFGGVEETRFQMEAQVPAKSTVAESGGEYNVEYSQSLRLSDSFILEKANTTAKEIPPGSEPERRPCKVCFSYGQEFFRQYDPPFVISMNLDSEDEESAKNEPVSKSVANDDESESGISEFNETETEEEKYDENVPSDPSDTEGADADRVGF
jgi:hypothetical protein